LPSVTDDLLASASSDPTGLLERLRRVLRDDFTITRELGRGGMGRVFLAEERALERRVALKVLPPELAELPDVARRFRREARTAGQLSHPHIMPVYQVAERDGLHFFTMPFVYGPSLRQVLRRTPRLPVELCRRYLLEAADALYYAHGQGVIHRDIKPENMLLEGGPGGRLLLTDFGIAKAIGSATTTLTRPGEMMGTPYYMAPEICGESEGVDARADQYSLGLVAYEMLAGRFPLTADSLAGIVYKHLHEYPNPLETIRPDVAADMRRVIERAIRKDPDDRYPSMRELRDALSRLRTAPARGGTGSGRSMRLALLSIAVVIATIFGSATHGRWGRGDPGLTEFGGASAGDSTVLTAGRFGGDTITRDEPQPPASEGPSGVAGARQRGAGDDAANRAAGGEDVARGELPGGDVSVSPDSGGKRPRTRPGGEGDVPAGTLSREAGAAAPAESSFVDTPDLVEQRETSDTGADFGVADSAEAAPAASDPRAAIAALLEAYREALEAEDLGRLGADVYRGSIPAPDTNLLSYWFDRGAGFRIETEIESLIVEGDTAAARVRQKMAFRLESTGDRREITESFMLHFRLDTAGWRLTSLVRRR